MKFYKAAILEMELIFPLGFRVLFNISCYFVFLSVTKLDKVLNTVIVIAIFLVS